MAANTNVKVAQSTGAAKDDYFTSLQSGLTEDAMNGTLNVLANDPGAAKLYSLLQSTAGLSGSSTMPVVGSALSALGASISINADGTLNYDGSAIAGGLQSLRAGDFVTDTFTYTVRMANGALSTATVSLQIAGVNDLATITGDDAGNVMEDGVLSTGGTLTVHDVDMGENVFAAVNGDALHGQYGDFTFDSASGAWTYLLRNGDANVQALNTGDSVTDSLIVTSLDGTAQSTIVVNIGGQNEPAAPATDVNLPVTFMVNRGQSDVNAHIYFYGFDNNDILAHANNVKMTSFAAVDTDNNGSLDSTVVHFAYKSGNFADFDVTLIGFVGLSAGQVQGGA